MPITTKEAIQNAAEEIANMFSNLNADSVDSYAPPPEAIEEIITRHLYANNQSNEQVS